MPPEADTVKLMVADRLRTAKREPGGAMVTVTWRGEQKHLHVISMPTDTLYYNPDTHRIRAQRGLDPKRNEVLNANPWCEEAQEYLAHLLGCNPANPDDEDPEFRTLVEELDDFGQRDPGIITVEGILVDGNTRCAALRELGVKNIRVGVLPDDAGRGDINDVELALQLRRDKRRDYSYVNRLIAIDERIGAGHLPSDVAREFNIKLKTLQADRWVHALILDSIERSRQEGISLSANDFENHQEKLRELYRDYSKLAAANLDGAERLKETRLATILLEFPKTTLRLVEDDFYDRYLVERLPDDLKPAIAETKSVPIPGLSDVSVNDAGADVKAARALTDQLLRAKAASQATKRLPPSEIKQADNTIRQARETFETATRMAGRNAELKKRKTAVPERLTDAAEYIDQCTAEFAEAKSKRALDEDAFDDALLVLKASFDRLARLAGRAFDTPGDGVAWLLKSAEESQ